MLGRSSKTERNSPLGTPSFRRQIRLADDRCIAKPLELEDFGVIFKLEDIVF
jgi:hypothetical protein